MQRAAGDLCACHAVRHTVGQRTCLLAGCMCHSVCGWVCTSGGGVCSTARPGKPNQQKRPTSTLKSPVSRFATVVLVQAPNIDGSAHQSLVFCTCTAPEQTPAPVPPLVLGTMQGLITAAPSACLYCIVVEHCVTSTKAGGATTRLRNSVGVLCTRTQGPFVALGLARGLHTRRPR